MGSAAVTYKSQKIVKPSLSINLPMTLCSVNLKMFVKEIIQSPDLDLHLDGLASRSGAGKIALEWRDRGVGVFYMPSHKIVTSMHSTGYSSSYPIWIMSANGKAFSCRILMLARVLQNI